MNGDTIEAIRDAASRCRVIEIDYLKPGAAEPTTRVVEPYRFAQAGAARMLVAWQVAPEALGDTSWRNFRLDRIASVRERQGAYQPRIEIRLDAEPEAYIFGYIPTDEQTPAQAYHRAVERAVLDENMRGEALKLARRQAASVDTDRMRTVHARVYRDVLDALLVDGSIDESDERFLRDAGALLAELGWSPAG